MCIRAAVCARGGRAGARGSLSSPEEFSQFVRVRKGENNNNKNPQIKQKLRERERGWGRSPAPRRQPPSASASSLLVVVVFLLLAVGQRGAGADLPVAVQPLLHHLGDERVVAAAGAFLESDQNATFCHTAVQPLPQELLLLLLITHLKDRREHIRPSEGAI